jgi:threonine dehydrogenase-like Zn-dependent dehydrogenase
VWERKINPGKVFDLTLPLDQVAEGYRAMDERRAGSPRAMTRT